MTQKEKRAFILTNILNTIGMNEPWIPPGYEVLKDTIDIHCHAGAGRVDEVELAKMMCNAGMRAVLLKSPRIVTVDAARLTKRIVDNYAKNRDLRPLEIFGGIVLNRGVCGGLNAEAVQKAVTWGAKMVWMPTYDSAAHMIRSGMSKEIAMEKGITILDGGDLKPEVEKIVNIIAEAGIALSFGHLGYEEMLALLDEGRAAGVEKFVVDHPITEVTAFDMDQQKELAKKGVYLNYVACEFDAFVSSRSPHEIAEYIKNIGPEHCTISSDTGWVFTFSPMEALRLFYQYMIHLDISQKELDLMMKENPAKILELK